MPGCRCQNRIKSKKMDKKEYDQIEEQANRLQSEAGRRCNQQIKEVNKYHEGYIQGVEDLLKVIMR